MKSIKSIAQAVSVNTGNMNAFIYGMQHGGSRMVGSKKKRRVTGKKK